jgi:hypothetical protein
MRITLRVLIAVAAFYLTALAVETGLVVLGLSTNGLEKPAAREHRAELVDRITLVAKAARIWAELPAKPPGCA